MTNKIEDNKWQVKAEYHLTNPPKLVGYNIHNMRNKFIASFSPEQQGLAIEVMLRHNEGRQ